MTNAELIAAAKAELEGVTEGPWTPDGPPWNMIVWSGAENRVCFMAHSNGLHDHRDLMTANFIAAARSRVPQLIAALEAAQAKVAEADRLNEALSKATSGGERTEFSYVGHKLEESSWHVHLAGFRSEDEATAALLAITAHEARKGDV